MSVTESLLTWMAGLADPRANNYVGKKKKKHESEGKDDPKMLLANACVTNLVRGLLSDCHKRSPLHHIDSHTTHHTGLHFLSSIALMTHTHS